MGMSMTKKEANAVMRQKYGAEWYDRAGGRQERNAFMRQPSRPAPGKSATARRKPSPRRAPAPRPVAKAPPRAPTPKVVVASAGYSASSGGYSEQGPRDYQEDRWYAAGPVVAVADGMGGHEAGDKAAEAAIEAVRRLLSGIPGPFPMHEPQPGSYLKAVVKRANHDVRELGRDGGRKRPGTTLVVGVAEARELTVANVGDSRCTMVYKGKLRRITKDHSHVQRLVDWGQISEEEARVHHERNIITRSLGHDETVEVDVFQQPLAGGETFAFTSDGIHDYVGNAEFARICESSTSAKVVAKALVEAALANGTNDNSTAVVMKISTPSARTRGFDDEEGAERTAWERNPRRGARGRRNPARAYVQAGKYRNPYAKRYTFDYFKAKYFKGHPVSDKEAREYYSDFRYAFHGGLGKYIRETTSRI